MAVSGDAVANPVSGNDNANSNSDLLQQIDNYSSEGSGSSMNQFPGATQFSDVSPGDWAFQALDDLIRRYDCLKGYPDGTYRGNRALSRYEFAAGLNACLQQIERLIAETTAEFATREDLETLRRLLQEFEAELATLGTRVDNLEARVAFLEDNQFSTTTKLNGEVIGELSSAVADERAYTFGLDGLNIGQLANGDLANPIAGNRLDDLLTGFGVNQVQGIPLNTALANLSTTQVSPNTTQADNLISDVLALQNIAPSLAVTPGGSFRADADDEITFGYRARLNFDTSFFGTDRLRTRLQSSNMNSLGFSQLGTTQLLRNLGDNDNNQVVLNDLAYQFPINDNIRAHIIARGASVDDILDSESTAPYSLDNLALANYYNNLFYDAGSTDQAIGFNIKFNENFGLDVAYLADDGEDASLGLFGGEYVLPVQLNMNFDRFRFALSYAHLFEKGGDLVDGTSLGETTPFAGGASASLLGQAPFVYVNGNGELYSSAGTANVLGFQGSVDISDTFNLSGYIGYGNALSVDENSPRFGREADYWSWGVNLALPDLGKEGAVLVTGISQLPKVSVEGGPSDQDSSYLASLEYRFPITDNIELAPGAYAVFNPNGNAGNDSIWVGMLRTKLKF
ncbi:iron uptake porin [Spirulina sp. CS-785/01]|uniref:iron uptake porin n=1 Tax=Spirulina sp. CS-785/01 TaxID=3021716 RepID=UPI002331521E|nr:iron uptake porin [Spirulina sp. CS-785/01]MDB9314552.1 iron uptake porin [Spirulina sp. CS-785/01]